MKDAELQAARELCEQVTPDVVNALRECVRQYVSRWYIKNDGGEAVPDPVSPTWRALDWLDASRTLVPALIDERDQLRARLVEVEKDNERLRTRQQELLATIVRVTNETPFSDEAKDALEQRGKFVAEIGTLRNERDEAVRELRNLRNLFAEVKHQRDCYMRAAKRVDEEF